MGEEANIRACYCYYLRHPSHPPQQCVLLWAVSISSTDATEVFAEIWNILGRINSLVTTGGVKTKPSVETKQVGKCKYQERELAVKNTVTGFKTHSSESTFE